MRVVILPDAESVSLRAADIVCKIISLFPDATLGLATGSTPMGTYQELIRRYQAGRISFAEVKTFNLDEYVGIPQQHGQSYWTYMHNHLFQHIDIDPQNCHVPCGDCDDLWEECSKYEDLIEQAEGIDLQLLGIGSDGHIGFNEPGSSLASFTRVKALTERTRRDNARFFGDDINQVPRTAITMGVGTILEAHHIVILATGDKKAAAARDFIEGPISSMVPASILQNHPKVTALLDEAAASLLQRADYYKDVELIQAELEPY